MMQAKREAKYEMPHFGSENTHARVAAKPCLHCNGNAFGRWPIHHNHQFVVGKSLLQAGLKSQSELLVCDMRTQ
jgi:hypothetical protein